MPPYAFIRDRDLDTTLTAKKISVMQGFGVPYSDSLYQNVDAVRRAQAVEIAENLKESKINVDYKKEIIALIAYLQRLGTDIKAQPQATTDQPQ